MAPKKKLQEGTRSTNDPRLGEPSRRVKKVTQMQQSGRAEQPESWIAQVIKAEQCNSEGYKQGQWTTVFEYTQYDREARCYLRGTGGLSGLVLTLFTDTGAPDTTESNPNTTCDGIQA